MSASSPQRAAPETALRQARDLGRRHGRAAVYWQIGDSDSGREFYRELTANFRIEQQRPTRQYLAADAVILDQQLTGTVTGTLLGMPGNGRRITFRLLHVFEFKDELISRENAWLDGAAIQQQLS